MVSAGSTEILAEGIYLGSTLLEGVYAGTEKIWPAAAPAPSTILVGYRHLVPGSSTSYSSYVRSFQGPPYEGNIINYDFEEARLLATWRVASGSYSGPVNIHTQFYDNVNLWPYQYVSFKNWQHNDRTVISTDLVNTGYSLISPSDSIIIEFTAKYQDIIVRFDANGGSYNGYDPPDQTVTYYTQKIAEPSDIPTKSGEVFIGYNTKADGSGDDWNFDSYLLTFSSNITFSSGNAPYQQAYFTLYAKYTASTAPLKLKGGWWATSTNYQYTMTTVDSLSGLYPGDVVAASWDDSSQSFTYQNNNDGSQHIFDSAFSDRLVEFKGWSNNESDPSTTISTSQDYDYIVSNRYTDSSYDYDFLVAKVNFVSVKVTFNGNGGTTESPGYKWAPYNSAIGTLLTATRSGYTFSSWNTMANGTGTTVTTSTVFTNATTIYAQWVSNTPLSVSPISLTWSNTEYGSSNAKTATVSGGVAPYTLSGTSSDFTRSINGSTITAYPTATNTSTASKSLTVTITDSA